ncbi:Outer membrane lipoprotein carrier protein LolA [uncultured Candidatus Thioglobus sp.]|nr:Outer membrane lipoprotein carrier protein LolA [uncultured Candidatus Thioglobus sp.]
MVLANTSGNLKFQRPAQFVWQTDLPFEQTLLLSNNELWLVDYELEQASMRSIDELKNTPLYWLINRPDQLDTLPSFTDSQQGVRWYSTQQDDTLSFGFVNKKLAAIKLNNRLDQQVLVSFSKLKTNPSFKQNTFKLTLGADFDVIR